MSDAEFECIATPRNQFMEVHQLSDLLVNFLNSDDAIRDEACSVFFEATTADPVGGLFCEIVANPLSDIVQTQAVSHLCYFTISEFQERLAAVPYFTGADENLITRVFSLRLWTMVARENLQIESPVVFWDDLCGIVQATDDPIQCQGIDCLTSLLRVSSFSEHTSSAIQALMELAQIDDESDTTASVEIGLSKLVIHFFSEMESKEVLQSYLQVMKQLIECERAQATAYRHFLKIAVKLAQREGDGNDR
jgi:hypothetical protein